MRNVFFIVGEVLLFLAAAAYFLEDILYQFLPEKYVHLLLEYKQMLLIVGVVMSVVGVIQWIQQKKAQYETERNKQSHVQHQEMSSNAQSHFNADSVQFRQRNGTLTNLAKETDWSPLQSGGTNFKTTFLKQVARHRMQTYRASGMRLITGAMLLCGLGGFGMLGYNLFGSNRFSWEIVLPVCVLTIFGAIGVALLYFPRPRIFDKQIGWFWQGSPRLKQSSKVSQQKNACQLDQIKALQMIDEYITSSDSDGHTSNYHSYELNLVLDDGSRLNVMDHGDKDSLLADANTLSEFLGVPVLQS